MAEPRGEWKVHPHGAIEQLTENLWRVQGTSPGMSLARVMTIARLADGRLVVHSAIALDAASMEAVERWGAPAILLVPGTFHRRDAAAYKQRYPALRVLAPKGARGKVAEVVAVDGTYDDFPADEAVRVETLSGVKGMEGVLIVRSLDGTTVVLNDIVFNMDRKRDVMGFLMTTLLGSAPGPRVSRLSKLMMVDDKLALRGELERLAALPGLKRLIVSHEKLATGLEAAAALREAATYLG